MTPVSRHDYTMLKSRLSSIESQPKKVVVVILVAVVFVILLVTKT